MRQDAGFNPSRPGQRVSRRSDERQVEETLPTNSWESSKDNRLLEAAHCIVYTAPCPLRCLHIITATTHPSECGDNKNYYFYNNSFLFNNNNNINNINNRQTEEMLTLAVGWSSCRFCDYFVVKVTIYMYVYRDKVNEHFPIHKLQCFVCSSYWYIYIICIISTLLIFISLLLYFDTTAKLWAGSY